MREFDVGLVHHSIAHGGVYLDMPQELLHLFYGHPFVDGHGGQRATELMRMDTRNLEATTQLTKTHLNARDLEPFVRSIQRHEQGRILVLAALEILLQMNLSAGIEIDHTLLIPLTEDNALTLVEVDICPV